MKFVLRTSEVKLAHHFAVRRNFTHEVNFTIEDNFTCLKGKLSFSVFSVKDNTLNRGAGSCEKFKRSQSFAIKITEHT